MSRTAYSTITNTWDDGDNPGAGSKTVDSTGLNGNFIKHDVCIQVGHNTDGTHKADLIDGPNLKTTAADGLTIELAGTPLKLGIKAEGVGTAFIGDEAVTADKLAAECIDAADKIVDGVITGAKMADNTIPGTKLASDAVTAPKMSHDNTARKVPFVFAITGALTGTVWATCAGLTCSGTFGVPMPRAGSIVAITFRDDAGSYAAAPYAYGLHPFIVGDYITVWWDDGALLQVRISGGTAFGGHNLGGSNSLIVVEVEWDD